MKTTSAEYPNRPGQPAAEFRPKVFTETASKALVIHYHLFKNAGTSIDEVLRHNFGELWTEQEFPGSGLVRSNVDAVTAYLQSKPHLVALSSHTALLPPPRLPNVTILPILFVRHPIDRLRSAYAFQRQQQVDTMGAKLAKENDFAGYLRALLPKPRNQACNFQAFRLSHCFPPRVGTERQRAKLALDRLPFIGLVEAYEKSLQKLSEIARVHFPNFVAMTEWKNVTPDRQSTLEQRLGAIEDELGSAFFKEICAVNDVDLEIYEIVRARYAALPG